MKNITLIFSRHGDYKTVDDKDVGLSDKGYAYVKNLIPELNKNGLLPSREHKICILYSPEPRSVESAGTLAVLLQSHVSIDPTPKECIHLRPSLSQEVLSLAPQLVIDEIEKNRNDFDTVIVSGHQPVLDEAILIYTTIHDCPLNEEWRHLGEAEACIIDEEHHHAYYLKVPYLDESLTAQKEKKHPKAHVSDDGDFIISWLKEKKQTFIKSLASFRARLKLQNFF